MEREVVGLMGLPIDSVTLDESVQRCLQMITDYREDLIPRYVGTVNTDFLSHLYGWRLWGCRDTELLHTLRAASLLLADGMPLVWLSGWLNAPVKERVAGVDLMVALLKELADRKGSVYLLGGETEVTNGAAKQLKNEFPGLKIVGATSPNVTTEGEYLLYAAEQDRLLLEEINEAHPDLLLLNLGNPKQEKWFSRIRSQLQVPLTMGVGGAFAFISGHIPRASEKWQQRGFEWLYRLFQEPGRLWKRYLKNILQFPFYVVPQLTYHTLLSLIYKRQKRLSPYTQLLAAPQCTFAHVHLPKTLIRDNIEEINRLYEEALNQDLILLNFSEVRFLDPYALGWLLQRTLEAAKEGVPLFFIGISLALKCFFKNHRIWDQLSSRYFSSAKELLNLLQFQDPQLKLFEAVLHQEGMIQFLFFGSLNHNSRVHEEIERFAETLLVDPCLVDLTYCTEIDQGGMSLLLRLQKQAVQGFIVKKTSAQVYQQLKNEGLLSLLNSRP